MTNGSWLCQAFADSIMPLV